MKRIIAIFFLTIAGNAAMAQQGTPNGPAVMASAMTATTTRISDVAINPNPVKGQNFTLELQNLEKGKYSIYAFNKDGKKYLLKVTTIENGTGVMVVDLPKDITPGTYILQVLSKTARYSKKMVVE